MKRFVAIVSPALLAACASTSPSEGPATNLVQVHPAPPVEIVEKVVPMLMPPEPVVREKAQKRQDPVPVTRKANDGSAIFPKPENFIGSTLVNPIVPGAIYHVLTAVNSLTSIELPPGCRMNKKSPSLGDPSHSSGDQVQATADDMEPANWEVTKTYHGTMRDPVSKVLIRPSKPGLKTDMLIDGDCGAFRYKLVSTESSANATVKFRQDPPNMGLPEPPYADDRRGDDARPAVLSCTKTPVAQVKYDYVISGDRPTWMPTDRDVFHNGKKLCIGLPDGLGNLETPAISRPVSGEDMTVHYRTVGRFVEIDQILPVVELKLGEDTVRLTLKR
jgi:type IV secretion system protein TrbG